MQPSCNGRPFRVVFEVVKASHGQGLRGVKCDGVGGAAASTDETEEEKHTRDFRVRPNACVTFVRMIFVKLSSFQ